MSTIHFLSKSGQFNKFSFPANRCRIWVLMKTVEHAPAHFKRSRDRNLLPNVAKETHQSHSLCSTVMLPTILNPRKFINFTVQSKHAHRCYLITYKFDVLDCHVSFLSELFTMTARRCQKLPYPWKSFTPVSLELLNLKYKQGHTGSFAWSWHDVSCPNLRRLIANFAGDLHLLIASLTSLLESSKLLLDTASLMQ